MLKRKNEGPQLKSKLKDLIVTFFQSKLERIVTVLQSSLKRVITFFRSFLFKKIIVACILAALIFLSVWLVSVLRNKEIWKGVIWQVQNVLPVDFDSVAAALGTEYAKLLFLSLSYIISVIGFYKTPLINSLSHHFLSNFDSRTFNRLQKFTGMLRWAGPQGEQQEAWDKLKDWLVDGAQGSWRSITPEVTKPFSWIVLCGPNGLGKTQLSLELGKSISEGRQKPEVSLSEEPTYWQNLKHRTHCWWRRGFDQPWDVGTLMGNSDKEQGLLEKWQPRRPTLIILNDPSPAFVVNYVQTLIRLSTAFRYPVRLLVIDQFEPLISDEKDIKETKAPSISMRTVEFSSQACGTSLKVQHVSKEEGVSGSGDENTGIKALWDVKDRDVFRAQTNGWPLIVALGALWLAKDKSRTVQELAQKQYLDDEDTNTSSYRDRLNLGPAAHYLIEERVNELIVNLPKYDEVLLRALACSTIAGGIPALRIRREYKSLPSSKEMKEYFPYHDWNARDDESNLFPFITPVFAAEVFLLKILKKELDIREDTVLIDELAGISNTAWKLHPDGMARTLVRNTWRNKELLAAIGNIPELAPEKYSLLIGEFTKHAICHNGKPDNTLEIIRRLAKQENAQQNLLGLMLTIMKLWEEPKAHTPHAVVLVSEICLHLTEENLPTAIEQLQALLTKWWRGTLTYSASEDKDGHAYFSVIHPCCKKLAPFLLVRLQTVDQFFEVTERLWDRLNQMIFGKMEHSYLYNFSGFCTEQYHLTHLQTAVMVAEQSFSGEDPDKINQELSNIKDLLPLEKLQLLGWHYSRQGIHPESSEVGNLRSIPETESDRWLCLFQVRIWAKFAFTFAKAGLYCDPNALGFDSPHQIDLITETRSSFQLDRDMQLERVKAWRSVVDALGKSGQVDAAREAILTLELITQAQAGFEVDRDMQYTRATAWSGLVWALTKSGQVDEARKAVLTLERITQAQPDFEIDFFMQYLRVVAWGYRAWALSESGQVDATREAVLSVERITQAQAAFKINRDMQLERARAWRGLAWALSKSGQVVEATRAAVFAVERITQAQAYDREMQLVRAAAAWHLAFALSNSGDVDATRKAVSTVERITQAQVCFEVDRDMQYSRAVAWRLLADAFSKSGQVDAAREAILTLELITQAQAGFEVDRDMQYTRAMAWRGLVWALTNSGQVDEARKAVLTLEGITEAQPNFEVDRDMQLERAEAWLLFAGVLNSVGGGGSALQSAANRVRQIVSNFPQDFAVTRILRQVEHLQIGSLVASARSGA